MRYIICEDSGSGYFFWWAIKEFVLKKQYKMVSAKEINSELNYKNNTIGLSKIVMYLARILDKDNDNIYIVCVDSDSTNRNLNRDLNDLTALSIKYSNMYMLDYTCLEELIISSGMYEKFVPNIANDNIYNIIKNHYKTHGLGESNILAGEFKRLGIRYETVERKYNEVLQNAVIISNTQKQVTKNGRLVKIDYLKMKHHYIYKGGWSICWMTDCTNECPNNRCWEATRTNSIMCENCNKDIKDMNDSCKFKSGHQSRKFAEEETCDLKENNINIPKSFKDRIRILFSIPEILAIDEVGE